MTIKRAFIDVETTGLDPFQHAVHQLAIIIEVNNRVVEELSFNIRPHTSAFIEPKALEVSGVTEEQILDYPENWLVKKNLTEVLGQYVNKFNKFDKFFFYAYNSSFDYQFARSLFTNVKDKYFGSWFFWPSIDIAGLLAHTYPVEWADLRDRKLKTIAETFIPDQVEGFQWHDALADIRATYLLWKSI